MERRVSQKAGHSDVSDEATPRLGRPRSEATDTAILQAAVELLDRRGYRAMTVDEIAAAAGVGKQTIYRRWPSKAAVVLDALTLRTAEEVPAPDTGSVEEDVRSLLRKAFSVLRAGRHVVVSTLMAEAQMNETFAEAFRTRFIAHRRDALADIIKKGVNRGELPADTDPWFVADMLYGPMWYRVLNRHAPIDDAFADALTAFVVGRLRLRP